MENTQAAEETENTSGNRGRDVSACRMMLHEAGFEQLLVARGRYHGAKEALGWG